MPFFRRRPQNHEEEIQYHQDRRNRAERLGGPLVEDMVLGANDGIITTFAVVAGATGGALGQVVILILGFANLFADAVSMGTGNYLGKRSKNDYHRSQRRMEEWEIEHTPDQEVEEVRDIFRDKGLEGEELEMVVKAVTNNKKAWVDVMMTMELGLTVETDSSLKSGFATFAAFATAGIVPLLPYLFCTGTRCFIISSAAAGIALFVTGALRTFITGINWLRGGLEVLGVGSLAAGVAYGVGRLIATIT